MAASEKHWVEELFPPKFGFSLDELLAGKSSDKSADDSMNEGIDCLEGASKKTSIFTKVAQQRVSPLDVSAIKNVYERVWLMSYLEDEERKKKQQEENSDSGQHIFF